MPETDIMTKTNTYCNLAATTLYADNYEQRTANGVTTTYDAADRLTNWTVNSAAYTADYYSGNGNPDNYRERKSDFGLYAYSGSKPHAVSGISSLIAGTGEEHTCEAVTLTLI